MDSISKILLLLIIPIIAQKNPNFLNGRNGIVQLFEWKWSVIADECESFLGPNGFAGVQVSPPNENVVALGRPWGERYQPVSYNLTTRSGTAEEFSNMVKTCNNAGVRIYVDVVINNMAALAGTGTAGNMAISDLKSFPAVPYSAEHFHPTCQVTNYLDVTNVRNCEYKNLRDLDQANEYVQAKISSYLNNLINFGVAGFRIDSAKYMWPQDLQVIYDTLKSLSFDENAKPYIYQDVNDLNEFAKQVISKNEYINMEDVVEFDYVIEINRIFGGEDAFLANLSTWGNDFVDSNDALVFVDNHEYQRKERILTYKSPKQYRMAIAFMLAHPYGNPLLMSSYFFTNNDIGPPEDRNENITPPSFNPDGTCGGGYVCEHRWRQIYQMISFRNTVAGTELTNWWAEEEEGQQISFCRGNKGFIAFNRKKDLKQSLQTCLPAGQYCDIISGTYQDGKCSGKMVTVGNDGSGDIEILAEDNDGVLAIHLNSKIA